MNENDIKNIRISGKQAVAYAVVALHTLKISPNKITEIELAKEIITIMRLHTPKEAIERANKILKRCDSK